MSIQKLIKTYGILSHDSDLKWGFPLSFRGGILPHVKSLAGLLRH